MEIRAQESTLHCPGWDGIMGKSKLFCFSAFCITFAKPNLEWVIWIWNVFSVQFSSFLHLDNQILCITSERCREGQSLEYFPSIFSFLTSVISRRFVLLRTFAFCVHLNWQQWEGSGQMANVAWQALEGKSLLTLTCNLFSYLWGWKCTMSAPVWGAQELLFPLVLAGSDRTCAKGFESQVSPQHPGHGDVCGRGGWVNWESMALLCSTSRTHDIMSVMSIASSNIRDISQCAGDDSITSRSPSRGGTSSTGLYCC